jgi:hypothetical protein
VTQPAVSARTALCGIFLHPAGHTRSPALHNAAYAALGIDAVYLAFDVRPGDLVPAIAGARAMGVKQLAISIPHKEAVIAHLDRIDETATRWSGAIPIGSASRARSSARASSREGLRWCSALAGPRAPRSTRCANAERARSC